MPPPVLSYRRFIDDTKLYISFPDLLGKELIPVHVIKTVSSCFSSLAQINRVKHVFDRLTLTTIINTYVFCKLFYCSSVWSNAADTNLLKLQVVQNFEVQIICVSRKFDHVTPLLKELYWLLIEPLHGPLPHLFACCFFLSPSWLLSSWPWNPFPGFSSGPSNPFPNRKIGVL